MSTIGSGRTLPRLHELVRTVIRPAHRMFSGQPLAAVVREYHVQRGIESVTVLDDRMLRDIGLSRAEIERVVRNGRQAD